MNKSYTGREVWVNSATLHIPLILFLFDFLFGFGLSRGKTPCRTSDEFQTSRLTASCSNQLTYGSTQRMKAASIEECTSPVFLNQSNSLCNCVEPKKFNNVQFPMVVGNWTQVFHVTGGNTNHYTTADVKKCLTHSLRKKMNVVVGWSDISDQTQMWSAWFVKLEFTIRCGTYESEDGGLGVERTKV
jgi:hypothetical protein